MTSVLFGDLPIGNITTMAIRKTVEFAKEEYPKLVFDNTYFNDCRWWNITEEKELRRDTNALPKAQSLYLEVSILKDDMFHNA